MKTFFKSFLVVLAMLGLLLCLSSCGKLKSISAANRLGPGMHWDVGFGFDNETDPGWQKKTHHGEIIDHYGTSLEKVDPYIIRLKGGVVIYRYNLTPSEQERSGMVALAAGAYGGMSINRIVKDENNKYRKARDKTNLPTCVDESNYKKGYVQFRYTLITPGIYIFDSSEEFLIVLRE